MHVQIASPEVEGAVVSAVSRAESAHGTNIRADSRYSPPAVAGQRAMIRSSLLEAAVYAERVKGKPRADEKRLKALSGAIAEALGLREVDKRIEGMEARSDSFYAPGELIARDPNPTRERDQRRAVQESIQSRNIDPGMQIYDSNGISYEGQAALAKPGMTNIPRAGYDADGTKRAVHSLVVATGINWEQALYGGASSINAAAENAEAADRALRRALETILVSGAVGTDLRGLFGSNRLKLAAHHSTLDLSADATTLAQIYSAFLEAAQSIQEANGDRGGIADTALISPTILRLISRKSNLTAGGGATGAEMFMAITQANNQLGQVFKSMGISQVQIAPSLNVVAGKKGDETDRAGIAFFERGNKDSLRRVIALAPSPVRTAEGLLGTETLWALRTGGLECPDATSAGVATFTVR